MDVNPDWRHLHLKVRNLRKICPLIPSAVAVYPPYQALAIGPNKLTFITRMSLLRLDLAVVSKKIPICELDVPVPSRPIEKGSLQLSASGLKHKTTQGGPMTNVQPDTGGQGRYSVVFSRQRSLPMFHLTESQLHARFVRA